MKGLITKLIGGLYTVKTDTALYECKARGKFRHDKISPKVGDYVSFDEKNNYILTIDKRINELQRPPICNVTQAILVFSCKEPDFNIRLLDRLLVIIEYKKIKPIIVITKMDLLVSPLEKESLKKIVSYYEKYYKIVYTSSREKQGLEEIKYLLKENITVLSGQSGVGKSSLINAIDSNFSLKTNEISQALGRGKHTTRHTELLAISGGLVADTPGFSKIDLQELTLKDLEASFVEFKEYNSGCKYATCMHLNEPGCMVKQALKEKKILASRYESYKLFYTEIISKRKY